MPYSLMTKLVYNSHFVVRLFWTNSQNKYQNFCSQVFMFLGGVKRCALVCIFLKNSSQIKQLLKIYSHWSIENLPVHDNLEPTIPIKFGHSIISKIQQFCWKHCSSIHSHRKLGLFTHILNFKQPIHNVVCLRKAKCYLWNQITWC